MSLLLEHDPRWKGRRWGRAWNGGKIELARIRQIPYRRKAGTDRRSCPRSPESETASSTFRFSAKFDYFRSSEHLAHFCRPFLGSRLLSRAGSWKGGTWEGRKNRGIILVAGREEWRGRRTQSSTYSICVLTGSSKDQNASVSAQPTVNLNNFSLGRIFVP